MQETGTVARSVNKDKTLVNKEHIRDQIGAGIFLFQTSAINFIAMASFEIKLFDTGFEPVWKLILACFMITFHRFV